MYRLFMFYLELYGRTATASLNLCGYLIDLFT